jgi:hypothetical protein
MAFELPESNWLAFPIAGPTSEAPPKSGVSMIGTASPYRGGAAGRKA